jgi:hypothetical protein
MSSYRKFNSYTVTEEELGYEVVNKDEVSDMLTDIENAVNNIISDIEDYDLLQAKKSLEQLSKELY